MIRQASCCEFRVYLISGSHSPSTWFLRVTRCLLCGERFPGRSPAWSHSDGMESDSPLRPTEARALLSQHLRELSCRSAPVPSLP